MQEGTIYTVNYSTVMKDCLLIKLRRGESFLFIVSNDFLDYPKKGIFN